jgi:hypothetical protein
MLITPSISTPDDDRQLRRCGALNSGDVGLNSVSLKMQWV